MRLNGTPLTDEEIAEAVAAWQEYGSIRAAARALEMAETSCRRRIHAAFERGLVKREDGSINFDPVMPGFRVNKVTTTTDGDGAVKSEIVQQVRDDGDDEEHAFEMPKGHVLGKGTFHITPDGMLKQAWLKTKEGDQDLIEAIKEVFKDQIAPAPLIEPPANTDSDLLSVYPIADQHLGLLAWGKETGDPYDLKIGEERLRACASRLIAQSPSSKQAILVNLGDWTHNDDSRNRTPAHQHILDVDSRYRKILAAGVRLMKDIVELTLQKHENVLIVNIPGNHDPHAAIALDIACMEAYANNPRVTVWGSPAEFFFHRFGNTLLGATHGHRCKPEQMAMAMAVRARKDWGETSYHWMMFGHVHHEQAKEVGDVRVESFQTLAANDAHHENSGYTSGKSLQSVTIHRNDGEIGRHRVNIPAPARHATKFKDAA